MVSTQGLPISKEELAMMASRISQLMTWLLFVGVLAVTIGSTDASAADRVAPRVSSRAISEKAFVPIGGIEQWITVKGEDSDNPIVLYLHGGPGDVMSPFADRFFKSWQRHFTLVMWDQRGAGRTYGKTGPSIEPTLTIDRLAQDGIEVAEYLTTHLHQKKIILVGASWGSILGIHMAKARPDLFCAYVGTAQNVNVQGNLAVAYPRLLAQARAAADQQAVSELEAIRAPPWDSLQKMIVYIRWASTYEAKAAPMLSYGRSPEYSSVKDQANYRGGETLSVWHLLGANLSGELMHVDLNALGTDFAIPIFIVQGESDLRTLPDFAKSYLDRITAPQKQFFLVPKTAHEGSPASWDMLLKVLLEQVRPPCVNSSPNTGLAAGP
jgi:pimeloyl-ACP methyl ester carboxylesterase